MDTLATILIVDDEPKNLQVLGNILKIHKFKIALASNGTEALELAMELRPDLILLDVMMPQMDGFEVCKKLKSDTIFSNTPVLFITALDDSESVVKGFEIGATDYITKPFNSKILISRILTHLQLALKTRELESLNQHLEQKVAERTFELEKANTELKKLDELKTEFLSIISHEIRTPLNGIMGFTQLISRTIKDDNIQRYIEALNKSAIRLERFSTNALEYTYLRSGKYKIKKVETDIIQLVNQTIEELKPKILDKKIQFNTQMQGSKLLTVDQSLIIKTLYSVLDNAVKYSPNESTIQISTRNLVSRFEIIVTDKGKGFSDKALNHLFKAFSPGELFINENEGIELALANLAMLNHNGEISIKNLENGASVSLIFRTNN